MDAALDIAALGVQAQRAAIGSFGDATVVADIQRAVDQGHIQSGHLVRLETHPAASGLQGRIAEAHAVTAVVVVGKEDIIGINHRATGLNSSSLQLDVAERHAFVFELDGIAGLAAQLAIDNMNLRAEVIGPTQAQGVALGCRDRTVADSQLLGAGEDTAGSIELDLVE
ncbi:hypothetical protein D9M71_420380 [compost metagenome]